MAGFKYAITGFSDPKFTEAKHGEVIDGITMLRFDIHHEATGVTSDSRVSNGTGLAIAGREHVEEYAIPDGTDECDIWAQVLAIMDGGEI